MRTMVVVTMALALWCGVAGAETSRGAWFQEAKYGVFIHFLGGGEDWNAKAEAFDAETFA